jgi:hypothetical protein
MRDCWSTKMRDALRASVVGFLRHGQEGLNNKCGDPRKIIYHDTLPLWLLGKGLFIREKPVKYADFGQDNK